MGFFFLFAGFGFHGFYLFFPFVFVGKANGDNDAWSNVLVPRWLMGYLGDMEKNAASGSRNGIVRVRFTDHQSRSPDGVSFLKPLHCATYSIFT